MPNVDSTRLDDMMRKINGLLAKADDSASTPDEAESCRNMAEKIMRKYKIEESELIASGDLKTDVLNVLFKDVGVANIDSEFVTTYSAIMSYIAHHTGCLLVNKGWGQVDGRSQVVYEVIGYESDIRYCEALFLGARLAFSAKMEPKMDPNLTDKQNVYAMRAAGMERGRIGVEMGWGPKAAQKVTRLYKQACEDLGEDPVLTGRSMNVKDFRQAYSNGFLSELWSRLSRARIAADREVGGGLVLADRAERIKEAMYTRYPSLRPDPSRTPAVSKTTRRKARGLTQAELRRMYSPATAAGNKAGTKAAAEVDITGVTPTKKIN